MSNLSPDIHVLIIEDDPGGVEVLGSHFQRLKVNYTHLFDSRKAVEIAEDFAALHAIFVDLEMPGADGFAVLKALKSHPLLRHVPTIAYTAHLSEMSNARAAGFDGFIGKPIRATEFPAQLTTILQKGAVWAVR